MGHGLKRTPEQRVSRGIIWLDKCVNRSTLPANWRSRIEIDNLRFADPDKGPLGQLFGSYYKGLNKLHIASGGGSGLGFRTEFNVWGDCQALKTAWEHALRTEPNWYKLGYGMTRIIKGVRFVIYWDRAITDKPVKIMMNRAGQAVLWPGSYKSYDSAARAVRKRIHTI